MALGNFDVIIVGGSYSGLSAAMALGRALTRVLIIDSGMPCNRQTPFSHNFLTRDGHTPKQIATIARQQVQEYETVTFFRGLAAAARKAGDSWEIEVVSGEVFRAARLVFATGIWDILPSIEGLAECWGISVLHCPYCHGYEVAGKKTGILANGEGGIEMVTLISNWTKDLALYTNGSSGLTPEQEAKLAVRHISVIDKEIVRLDHIEGQLQALVFKDGSSSPVTALYTRAPFVQHCMLPAALGCELTEEGHIRVDAFQETTVSGIYACGDNASRIRTVAHAISAGTMAGIAISRKMIFENF
ncbi:MAG: NAD(P)/FAD-dependent oxidoreductase [Bacteroidetes bacterium]|nr:NAD(P)/FAD-dependent oxidoreductase [Bacteroidota bacterium]